MILRNLLWVGLGSFAGGVLRYLIAQPTRTHGFDGSFPWGTFIVNLTGSFLLGLLFGLSAVTQFFPMKSDCCSWSDFAEVSPPFLLSYKKTPCCFKPDNTQRSLSIH